MANAGRGLLSWAQGISDKINFKKLNRMANNHAINRSINATGDIKGLSSAQKNNVLTRKRDILKDSYDYLVESGSQLDIVEGAQRHIANQEAKLQARQKKAQDKSIARQFKRLGNASDIPEAKQSTGAAQAAMNSHTASAQTQNATTDDVRKLFNDQGNITIGDITYTKTAGGGIYGLNNKTTFGSKINDTAFDNVLNNLGQDELNNLAGNIAQTAAGDASGIWDTIQAFTQEHPYMSAAILGGTAFAIGAAVASDD